jgi:Protein of unknown function (DUF1572)
MGPTEVLESCVFELRKMKRRADRALDQVSPEDLFRKLDPDSNSLAEIMKHVGGNLRSRWTDFLNSDGEKAQRNRDAEFVATQSDTPESLRQNWESGWACLFESLARLTPEQMDRSVRIREEAHSVIEAIHRTMTHTANHVGQIIYMAKHFAGPRWQTLTVPRGRSEQYTAAMRQNPVGGYLSKG